MEGQTATSEAAAALRLADAEPGHALAAATRAAHRAEGEGDRAAGAIAHRAWGLALLHHRDLGTAITHLKRAVSLGRSAGSVVHTAEARMTLAFALNQHGRPLQALLEIDAAVHDLHGVAAARAQAQRGAIMLQLGRVDEAMTSYRAALPILHRAGDLLWEQRVLVNRGVAHAQRYELAAAEADLHDAERLCVKLDLGLQVGFIQSNLAYVIGLRGDIPTALAYYDRAEAIIREHHAQVGTLLQDRSELLLSARLISEARLCAERATEAFQAEQRGIKTPEVLLLLAQVALLEGDANSASRHAFRARRDFNRQHRPEWAALAHLTALRSDMAGASSRRINAREIGRVVDTLVAADWPAAAVEARLVAALLSFRQGHDEQGRGHLRAAISARRRSTPATLRARTWYAEALLRLDAGNPAGALRAVRSGLRILDQHSAALGATDLRAHAAGHRTELAELGLRIALRHPARLVFEWAELGRARHLLQTPVRPPDDPAFAEALTELRTTVAAIDAAARGGVAPGTGLVALTQRQVALEHRIRDFSRRQSGDPANFTPGVATTRELAAALGDKVLLEFVQHDDELYVISIADGRTRLRKLGSPTVVEDLLDRIPFALRRLSRGQRGSADSTAALALFRHVANLLDVHLLRPVGDIGDRPLVIVPTGALQRLPWSILPSCAGRPLTVTPSATLWLTANRRPPSRAHRVAVVAGPGLPGADFEASAVAAIHGTAALRGPAATASAVTAALDGAAMVHMAAHGRLSAQNPLFSSLLLADGPLFVHDLEHLTHAPHTVILAACDSGRSIVPIGDELLGLSATFLARGTVQLIASMLPLPDLETADLMIELHRRMALGEPPAVALANAQTRTQPTAAALVAAAGFVCLGGGFTPPPRPADPSPA